MIYSGDKAYKNKEDNTEYKDTIIDKVSFNNSKNQKEFNGYTYLDENINEINSNIKSALEKWYEENILNTQAEKEIIDTIYCNNKLEVQTDIDNLENNNIIYNAYDRIIKNEQPNFNCSPSDSYTVSLEIGNGSLKYPVGLITADELLLIGNDYINTNIPFWTMTSAKFENEIAYNFSYNNSINITQVDEKLGIRPVITISSDNLIGNGTKEEPFRIKEIDNTKEVG